MIKTCKRCGNEFEAKTCAKYCASCRYEVHKERMRLKYYTTERHLRVERVRCCAVCGKEFEAHHRMKYCPACRDDAYKKLQHERNRRYKAAHRGENRDRKPVDPQKQRLAYLRRRWIKAQTPDERSKYFRMYVLLKQELNRGRG